MNWRDDEAAMPARIAMKKIGKPRKTSLVFSKTADIHCFCKARWVNAYANANGGRARQHFHNSACKKHLRAGSITPVRYNGRTVRIECPLKNATIPLFCTKKDPADTSFTRCSTESNLAGVAGFEPTNDGVRVKLTSRKIAVFTRFWAWKHRFLRFSSKSFPHFPQSIFS